MTNTILLVNGLTPLQTWGLIALVVFALAGVWFLLSLALDAINDWLNQRAYDAQYRINETREQAAEERRRLDVLVPKWVERREHADGEARQLKAWTDAQEAFKHSGRRVQ